LFYVRQELGIAGLGNTIHRISVLGMFCGESIDLTETDRGLEKIKQEFSNFK